MKAIINGKEVELSGFTVVTQSRQETYSIANELKSPEGFCQMEEIWPAQLHETSARQLYCVRFSDLSPLLQ